MAKTLHKIKGPIKLGGGQMDPKMKEHIKKHGIRMPFGKDFKYTNKDIDSWFRVKNNGRKYKFSRLSNQFVEDKG